LFQRYFTIPEGLLRFALRFDPSHEAQAAPKRLKFARGRSAAATA